jgi:hypothetical protein
MAENPLGQSGFDDFASRSEFNNNMPHRMFNPIGEHEQFLLAAVSIRHFES